MAIAASACSARNSSVVTPGGDATATTAAAPFPPAPQTAAAVPGAASGSLESFMAKVRRLSAEPRPERVPVDTLESTDAAIKAALAAAIASSTPATYRALAYEYSRWGVFDRAYGYLERALRIDPRDPLTYEALARLWRDGGLAHIALGDAHRAVHYSNGSARSRNLLGTILQALGRHGEARREYVRAIALEPNAAYLWSNLCYAWLLEGKAAEATTACETALQADPDLAAAQNNLGLARAQAGDLPGAERAFALAGVKPRALFNVGIVQLAEGRYAEAAESFQRAYEEQPSWTHAARRARQARDEARRRQEE